MLAGLFAPKQLDTNSCQSIEKAIDSSLTKAIRKSVQCGDYKYEYYCIFQDRCFVESPKLGKNFHWNVRSARINSDKWSESGSSLEQKYTINRIKEKLASSSIDPLVPPCLAYVDKPEATKSEHLQGTENTEVVVEVKTAEPEGIDSTTSLKKDKQGDFLQMEVIPSHLDVNTKALSYESRAESDKSLLSVSSEAPSAKQSKQAIDEKKLSEIHHLSAALEEKNQEYNELTTSSLKEKQAILSRIRSIPPAECDKKTFHSNCPVLDIPMAKNNMVKITLRVRDTSGDIIKQEIICSREAAYHCAINSKDNMTKRVLRKPKDNPANPPVKSTFTYLPIEETGIQQVTESDELFFPLNDDDHLAVFTTNMSFAMPFPMNMRGKEYVKEFVLPTE